MSIAIARLRTGVEVPAPLVRTVMLTLTRLTVTDPIAFYEAVMMAREPGHEPFGSTAETLKRYGFIDIYPRLHGSVRDIILAAVDGAEFDMHLVSPYADDSATEAQS